MKQLLVVAALVALVYIFFLSGSDKPEEKPEVIYHEQVQKVEQLEEDMQEALEQRMQEVDGGSGE